MANRTCMVPDCGQPRRKRDWCASHYNQWRLKGEVHPFAYKWSSGEGPCAMCGDPVMGRSRFCSVRCRSLNQIWPDGRPAEVQCQRCGDGIPLDFGSPEQRATRADTLMCKRCRAARSLRHKTSASVLRNRDGSDCGICHEPIDFELKSPDIWRVSVDHIFPWSRGGTNDPENLQLAHLICNQRKHATIPV